MGSALFGQLVTAITMTLSVSLGLQALHVSRVCISPVALPGSICLFSSLGAWILCSGDDGTPSPSALLLVEDLLELERDEDGPDASLSESQPLLDSSCWRLGIVILVVWSSASVIAGVPSFCDSLVSCSLSLVGRHL